MLCAIKFTSVCISSLVQYIQTHGVYPLSLSPSYCRDLQGVVVAVDELGHLVCCYLGTDPSTFTPPSLSSTRELNYSEMEREIRELQKEIKMAEKG